MPFHSLGFLLFLPVVFLVFHAAPGRVRWIVLLTASLVFYAAVQAPSLLAVLLLVAASTWAVGIRLDRAGSPGARRAWLWGGIGADLLVLGVLRYLPFLLDNSRFVAASLDWRVHVPYLGPLAAVGVSFYIFQAISYLIDIDIGVQAPEPRFGRVLLYLAFFPKLLQGPIERAGDFLPQIDRPYVFDFDNVRGGIIVFAWGLFKKLVIADRLGLFVDGVWDDVHSYAGLPLILTVYAYAFQIYFDFSGYTDMALGAARLLNIRLTGNFDRPYLAVSIADFWRRWHITFSRWILDYVFRPLQMRWRDRGVHGTALALLVTFLVCGVWHGAAWGYVAWGLLHGVYLASSVYWRPWQARLHGWVGGRSRVWRAWRVLITFHLVCFAWIFFRARRLDDALYVVANLATGLRGVPRGLADAGYVKTNVLLDQPVEEAVLAVAGLLVMAVVRARMAASGRTGMDDYLAAQTPVLRWAACTVLTLSIVVFGVYMNTTYIYQRF